VQAGAPDLLDQAIRRDDLVRVQEQVPEQGSLLPRAELDGVRPFEHLQRAEHPELHRDPHEPRSTATPGL
jgi:hypothetical protein